LVGVVEGEAIGFVDRQHIEAETAEGCDHGFLAGVLIDEQSRLPHYSLMSSVFTFSRFVRGSLGGKFLVELGLVLVIPGEDAKNFAERAFRVLLDDLLRREALKVEGHDLVDGHASAIDAQIATADAGCANKRDLK